MKINLAENMLRFGAKNLTEASKRILEQLSEAPEVAAAKPKKLVVIPPIRKSPDLQSAIDVGAFLKGQYGVFLDKNYVATDIAIVPNVFGATTSLFAYSKINLSRGEHAPRPKQGATNTDTSGGALTNDDSASQGTIENDKYMLGNAVSKVGALYKVSAPLNSLKGDMLDTYANIPGLYGTDTAYIASMLISMYGASAVQDGNYEFAKEIDRIMNILVQVPGLAKNPTWDQNTVQRVLGLFSSMKSLTKHANAPGLQNLKSYYKIV